LILMLLAIYAVVLLAKLNALALCIFHATCYEY